ncbi:MAG: hypothetical protein NVS2B14_13520 [Chamaesiphon sp.]
MNLLPQASPKVFSLLSVGLRGVGKTVFLAGSYAELHSVSQTKHHYQLWFDSQDQQVKENIESILSYVAQSNQYPPPTMKITDFNFSLKRHSFWGIQTLCHFRWWDIPGELCNIENSDFRNIVFRSQGCCVFIDAYALVHQPNYHQTLEKIVESVMPIANLVSLNRLKYAFALILTKCDMLEPDLLKCSKFEEGLQPLTNHLDVVNANYQTFYSEIPVVSTESGSALKATGAATPLLWLVCEIAKNHNAGLRNNPLLLLTYMLPNRFRSQQSMVQGTLQNLMEQASLKRKTHRYRLPLVDRKYISILTTLLVGLLGIIIAFKVQNIILNYEQERQTETDAIKKAIPIMERLVQEEPKSLELRLQLAELYQKNNQLSKAETTYNQIIGQQENNLNALIGKAKLRHLEGDNQSAENLFTQAEKAAPPNLKAQVHALAKETLQHSK